MASNQCVSVSVLKIRQDWTPDRDCDVASTALQVISPERYATENTCFAVLVNEPTTNYI
jgi:hypothetical protein